MRAGSASAERVGQGEVGGVTRRVTCTWWLPGLAVKAPWLGPQGDMHMVAARLGCQSTMVGTGWANSCPGCMDRLRKRYSHLVGGSFLAGKVAWTLSGCMTTESADYCMLVNEWAWSRSRVWLLRLEVDLGAVLESELGQKWRYGALKACIG